MPRREITVTALPAFADNYLWMIHQGLNAVAVDPGDATVVQQWLEHTGHRLTGILLTHHHSDHIGGVERLRQLHAGVPVVGHRHDAHRLPPLDRAVVDGDAFQVPGLDLHFEVLATAGHTLGHVCYFGEGYLFCGDTLFSAGCGRMFEGTPEQFQQSLSRLAALPEGTQVFAAHEYTLGNLSFAASMLPEDGAVQQALRAARARRAAGESTLPSTLAWERTHNPFLRCSEPMVAAAVGCAPAAPPAAVFAALRSAKNHFRSP